MKNDDFATAAYQRSEPPRPLRAKYYHGNKIIIIADANDQQIKTLISEICKADIKEITH